jgi:hypothetical protein
VAYSTLKVKTIELITARGLFSSKSEPREQAWRSDGSLAYEHPADLAKRILPFALG